MGSELGRRVALVPLGNLLPVLAAATTSGTILSHGRTMPRGWVESVGMASALPSIPCFHANGKLSFVLSQWVHVLPESRETSAPLVVGHFQVHVRTSQGPERHPVIPLKVAHGARPHF